MNKNTGHNTNYNTNDQKESFKRAFKIYYCDATYKASRYFTEAAWANPTRRKLQT